MTGHQPNYLPWLGFFEKMRYSEVFIIADTVQFERQGFTNRNKIKTPLGAKWLTVPVKHAGHPLPINEVEICYKIDPDWAKRHWLTLKQNYCKAPFWPKYSDYFEEAYAREWTMLIDLNMHLIKVLMHILNIDKRLVTASSLGVSGRKSEGILKQCKAVRADILYSGVGAKNYLDLKRFEEEGIKVVFQDFHHPVYPQLYGAFLPNLSVVDYIFCSDAKTSNSSIR